MDIDEIFEGRRVPAWFRDFAEAPQTAMGALLVGCANLGALSAAEPTQVLLDWLEAYGDREGFASAADVALAGWVSTSWGIPELPAAASSAVLTAVAWCRCANVIAVEARLSQAAAELRERVMAERRFLDALNFGRARDPLGRAWFALAWHQQDRSLLAEWWRLCSLPLDEPWYRGQYGIHGLRGLPSDAAVQENGWSGEMPAQGLAKLGRALARRARERWLDERAARQEFQSLARLTMGAYPFPEAWQEFWSPLKADRDEVFAGWVASLVNGTPQRRAPVRRLRPDRRWADVARNIAQRLSSGQQDAIVDAEPLLDQQARYAEATGDTEFVVKSACNFAGRIASWRPEQALRWTEDARRYDPSDPYGWNTAVTCLLNLNRLPEARLLGLQAIERFPQDVVARTGLAEVLRAAGRLDEAEALYRETVDLFPQNVVARTGLAEVLRAAGRLEQALEVYEETAAVFPTNEYARNGLNAVRREIETGVRDMADHAAPADETGRRRQGIQQRPAEPDLRSQDIEVLLADAHLLRRWGRGTGHIGPTDEMRAEARRVLQGLRAFTGSDPRAIAESGLLMLATDDLDDAVALLRDAHFGPFSQSARVSYALARAERELRRRGVQSDAGGADELPLWRALERSSLPLRPLALLGQARAHHARNGTGDEEALQDALGRLGRWASQTVEHAEARGGSDDKFPSWWAGHVLRILYDGTHISGADELGDLAAYRSRLGERAEELDAREDEYLYRHASD